LSDEAQACEKIRILSLADLLGESIKRINEEASLSSMFMD
jgi:ribose-phosphate pyrophosphokinase